MRVLFVTPPVLAHAYPMVPTAWALRAAGHEVLVATCGSMSATLADAGLVVTDAAPGQELAAIFRELYGPPGSRPRPSGPPPGDKQGPPPGPPPGPQQNPFAILAERMLPGVLAAARAQRPDLVVYTPHGYAGPVAAAKSGVPAVLHGLGLGPGLDMVRKFYGDLGEFFAGHDVMPPAFEHGIDVAPPSMRVGESVGAPMRYVPFNGGAVVPDWVREPPERRRVLITLGTTVPSMVGLEQLTPLWTSLRAAENVDAEFVLALGDIDTAALGELPANVRLAEWVPLAALLPSCAAAIHHGGSGTAMSVLDAGVPQIVLPQGADQFANADAIGKRGNGIVSDGSDLDAALITRVLEEDALRTAATEVRAELRAMPEPSAMAERLTEIRG